MCDSLRTVDETIQNIQSRHDVQGQDMRSSINQVNGLNNKIGMEMEEQQAKANDILGELGNLSISVWELVSMAEKAAVTVSDTS